MEEDEIMNQVIFETKLTLKGQFSQMPFWLWLQYHEVSHLFYKNLFQILCNQCEVIKYEKLDFIQSM